MVIFIALIFAFLTSATFQAVGFLDSQFGKVSFDQLMFFATMHDGIVGTDPQIVHNAQMHFLVRPAILTLSLGLIFLTLYWLIKKSNLKYQGFIKKIKFTLVGLCFASLPIAATSTLQEIGAIGFFKKPSGPDLFAQLYSGPPQDISVRVKNNLILLYVESLETTFADKTLFEADLNAPLDNVFNQKAKQIIPTVGTNWTTAGMVSSQCGVPLAPFMRRTTDSRGIILEKSRCISDYLKIYGYEQIFFVGPDLKFSGMDRFYNHHGYNKTIGKEEIKGLGLPDQLFTGWGKGPHDDTLLDLAQAEITKLHRDGINFNVTIMTTDNHAPDGVLSPRCSKSLVDKPPFARVINCTNLFVEKFVTALEKEGVFKDTVLVVMGDHLFMNNASHARLPPREERFVYFNYRAPHKTSCSIQRDFLTHFDVAPTLLALVLGSPIERLGLGFNACLPQTENLKEVHRVLKNNDVANHSNLYRSLW
jgi:phosphoglycerol transferase